MFRYEKEENTTGTGPLRFYRVVDDERALRLELQRSDQSTDQFWFWWDGRCAEFFVEQLPSPPKTSEIHLSIITRTLRDRLSGVNLDRDQLKIVAPLIHEALEAFWRGAKGSMPMSKFTARDNFVA